MLNFFSYLQSKKPKTLLFIIFNSFGEFDLVAPLAHKITNQENYKIKILILNLGIYKQFISCKYYNEIFKKLNITVEKSFFSYDTNFKEEKFFILRLFRQVKNVFFFLLNIPQLTYQIFNSNICFIENSTAHMSFYLFDLLSRYLKRNFILYPHTAARTGTIPSTHKKTWAKLLINSPFIISDKLEIGFNNARNLLGPPLLISYPPKEEQWINFIRDNFQSPFKNKDYFTIFLNGIRDEYFEPEDYYNLLHLTLKCLEIRHKNSLIILKRHPRPYREREENKILERILIEFNHLNIKFDSSPNFILSLYSKCNLILNNGSIFTAHAMNKISYFLFLNNENFKNVWEEGRNIDYYNLPKISTKDELINKLDRL